MHCGRLHRCRTPLSSGLEVRSDANGQEPGRIGRYDDAGWPRFSSPRTAVRGGPVVGRSHWGVDTHATTTLRAQAVLFLAVLAQASTAAAQLVESIGPPSWWVERDEQGLMLLIEGSGLAGAEVRVARGPIRVARVEPGRQGHALFVEVMVPGGADAGRCEFEIAAGGKTIRRPWELVPKPARRPEPFGPDDVLYLVMIDRFANGDPANDEPAAATRCSTAATPMPTTAATSPASAAGSPTWSTWASRRSG